MSDANLRPRKSRTVFFAIVVIFLIGLAAVLRSRDLRPAEQQSKSQTQSKNFQPKEQPPDSERKSVNSESLEKVSVTPPNPQRAFQEIKESKAVSQLLSDPRNQLKEAEKVEGSGVWTMKYQHYYEGLEVIGSMAMYHSGPGGEQIQTHLSSVEVNTKPDLKLDKAETLARRQVGTQSRIEGQPELKILPPERNSPARLIYEIKAIDAKSKPHQVWIDAHSGKIVADMARSGFL